MIDPRDEVLFERYFSILLRRFAYPVQVTRDDVATLRLAAEAAVEEHRALFPLPAPGAPPKPPTEPWEAIIAALWDTDLPARLIPQFSVGHAASVIDPEIKRLLSEGIIYERPDKTLAIRKEYRTTDPADGLAKIAAALGGAPSPAAVRNARNGTALSPCCGAHLKWEQIQGMRMVRERDGRNVYSAECSVCHVHHELDGGPVE